MDHLLKQWGIDCLRNSTGFCGTYDVEVTQQCRVSKVYPGILMMSCFLFFVTKRMSCDCVFTAHKRSLGQGNIFRSVCQEFCPQWGEVSQHALQLVSQHALQVSRGWYPSMPCRSSGPHPRGKIRGMAWGDLQAHTWGISRPKPRGVSVSRPTLGGRSPDPHLGGYPTMH